MVSRQAAVNIANDLIISVSGYEQHNHAVNSYSAELMKLPSAEPEYKELQDWKTDFKGFIGALDMPRDDYRGIMEYIDEVPSAETEIIKCKDCKFYTPMNRETKTGICNLTMHQNFGDDWYCAGAERRTDE